MWKYWLERGVGEGAVIERGGGVAGGRGVYIHIFVTQLREGGGVPIKGEEPVLFGFKTRVPRQSLDGLTHSQAHTNTQLRTGCAPKLYC